MSKSNDSNRSRWPLAFAGAAIAVGVFIGFLVQATLREPVSGAGGEGGAAVEAANKSSRYRGAQPPALRVGAGAEDEGARPWDSTPANTPERKGFIPAWKVQPPPRESLSVPDPVPPPEPSRTRPPMDNPGGVDGDRPPRPVPGLNTDEGTDEP